MHVIEDQIGNVKVLIQSIDENVELVGSNYDDRNTFETGIQDEIKDVYINAKSIIKAIAKDIGSDLQEIKNASAPNNIEMEFALGFSAKLGLWVLNGTAESSLKVKMHWDLIR